MLIEPRGRWSHFYIVLCFLELCLKEYKISGVPMEIKMN